MRHQLKKQKQREKGNLDIKCKNDTWIQAWLTQTINDTNSKKLKQREKGNPDIKNIRIVMYFFSLKRIMPFCKKKKQREKGNPRVLF